MVLTLLSPMEIKRYATRLRILPFALNNPDTEEITWERVLIMG